MKVDPSIKADLKDYIINKLSKGTIKSEAFHFDRKVKEEIEKFIAAKFDEKNKKIVVTSPYNLNKEEMNKIISNFPFIKRNEFEIENKVDKDIMAGIIIKFGSKILDLSINAKLKNLQKNLYEAS